MKVTRDILQVATENITPDGKPVEPEEKPAQRVMEVESTVALSTGPGIAGEKIPITGAKLPTAVLYQGTAGDYAVGLRKCCGVCKHFDSAGWTKLKKSAEQSNDPAVKADIHKIKTYLINSENCTVNDTEIEETLGSMGLCRALEAIMREYSIVHPLGVCPDHLGPAGENLSQLFQSRDRTAAKVGAGAYDKVMRLAQGKSGRRVRPGGRSTP